MSGSRLHPADGAVPACRRPARQAGPARRLARKPRPATCAIVQMYRFYRYLKPDSGSTRRRGCMGTLTGALPLPAFGSKVAVRSKVDYQNTPEGALVRRAQAGEESAFREIVERFQTKVFSIIHGIVRQRNDVEDIAQQVFAKVYLSLRNFDFRSSLITWIYKITVNECFDYLRKKKVRKLVYESDLSEDEVRRVENADPAIDRQPAADLDLARRDYVLK